MNIKVLKVQWHLQCKQVFQTSVHIKIPVSIVTQMPVDDFDRRGRWEDLFLLYEIKLISFQSELIVVVYEL